MTIHLLGALAILATPGATLCTPVTVPSPADAASGSEVEELPRIVRVAGAAFDASVFFEHLVARYRGIEQYADETSIIHVTRPLGEERSHRVETRIECDVREGRLNVRRPTSQVGRSLIRGLGLTWPLVAPQRVESREAGEAAEETESSFDLWLAPHLALKFAENPLSEFRAGVPEGFTPTEAAPVTMDDKPMVHIELKSGDGLSGDYTAKFDLYVDPDSMLIERIEGQQRLPDGADFQTTMDIKPKQAEGADYVRPGPGGFTEPAPRPCGIDTDAPVEEEADGAAPEPEPAAPPQTAPGMPVG